MKRSEINSTSQQPKNQILVDEKYNFEMQNTRR